MRRFSADQVIMFSVIALVAWAIIGVPLLHERFALHGEGRSPEQHHSALSQNESASEPRGTANAPFFVQINPAPKSAEETAAERQEREDKSANEWRLVLWTAILALVTGALVLVAGIQAGLFLVQLRYMREGMTDAAIAANAARNGAIAARDGADISKLSMVAGNRA